MGHKARILVRFWIVGCSLLAHAGEATAKNPQLAVFVMNGTNAPQRNVLAAERNAAGILQHAGVDVRWLNCGAGDVSEAQCRDIERPAAVVRLIPHARSFGGEVFGVSFVNGDAGTYADLFFEPIEQLHKENKDISLATILGDVLAHELGHLLLGSNAHSEDGIMQAHWTKDQLRRGEMGRMRFSEHQALRIRSRVAALQGNEQITLEAVNR